MVRRLVAGAAAAIAFTVASGSAVWFARLHAVAEAAMQQGRLARVLFDAHAAPDARMARSLLVPGLRVVVEDYERGVLFDAAGTTVAEHPLPGEPPPGPQPFPPPPGAAGAPPEAAGAPPEAAGAPPGAAGAPPGSAGAPNFAARLARIAPVRVETDDAAVNVGPDADSLASWLIADVVAVLAASFAIAAGALTRTAAHARAERRALEKTSEARREAAERYQRFLSEAAHELRTPLTIVSGYVDILRTGRDRDFDERILEGLHAETGRMRRLVAKMLTLARLDAPSGVPRLVDVAEALRATVERTRRRYPERSISLDANALRAGRIVIDADDFDDALANLLENAIKYAPDSAIAVRAGASEGRIAISVADRGAGIAAEDRVRIFERFYRGGGGRSAAEGLGLGLAIVKGVAERWNGAVTVESVPGNTAFTLHFPLADEERHAAVG